MAGGNAKFRTQVRDIALATSVRLSGQDPKDFGFDRIRMGGSQVFHAPSLAFEDDAKREEAIRKWMRYRGQQAPAAPSAESPKEADGSRQAASDQAVEK